MKLIISSLLLLALQAYCFTNPTSVERNLDWKDVKWIDSQIAILLTNNGSVYRTVDVGKTWDSLNHQLDQSTNSGYQPTFIYSNNHNNSKIYIRGRLNINWVSSDKGASWKSVNVQQILINLEWHPINSDWILARDGAYGVYMSKDFGASYSPVVKKAYGYSWGDAGTGIVPQDRVYLIVEDGDYYSFQYTDDFGATNTTMVSRGVDFEFHEKQIFAATWIESDSIDLKVSDDLGNTYKKWLDAVFPSGTALENHLIAILDDHTGAAFVGVIHDSIYGSYGNLYVSDATGARYSTSLNNVHQEFGLFDFARVNSVEGVYIANQIVNPEDQDPDVVSLITFDNGNTWSSIVPPHRDSHNNTIICSGCSLHLHCYASVYGDVANPIFDSVYAPPTAVGFILANGNIGTELSFDLDVVNTYASRDGGLTWYEVKKGGSHFEVGDHGGIVLLIPAGVSENVLYFSLDYGHSVQPYQYVNDNITVTYIVSEREPTQEKFVILGSHVGGGKVVVGIDFSAVLTTICTDDDYELWSPHNANGTCLLGSNTIYKRRKATSYCFNDETVEQIMSDEPCQCTEDDWECDYNFERASDGTCQYVDGPYDPTYPPEDCVAGGIYYETNGYRKEAGNKCTGGVDHAAPGPFNCPSSSKSKGWIAAAVLIPMIIFVLVLAALAIRSDKVREKLPFLKFLATWRVGYSGVSNPSGGGHTSLLDDEDELERENDDFSIQAEEIEEKEIENLEKKAEQPKKVDSLIQMDDIMDHDNDDFDPRK